MTDQEIRRIALELAVSSRQAVPPFKIAGRDDNFAAQVVADAVKYEAFIQGAGR